MVLDFIHMSRVQVKTESSHCDCICELKKKVVTASVTTTKKAGSHSLVAVAARLQSLFGHIQNHSCIYLFYCCFVVFIVFKM